jgi:hypothetical protein
LNTSTIYVEVDNLEPHHEYEVVALSHCGCEVSTFTSRIKYIYCSVEHGYTDRIEFENGVTLPHPYWCRFIEVPTLMPDSILIGVDDVDDGTESALSGEDEEEEVECDCEYPHGSDYSILDTMETCYCEPGCWHISNPLEDLLATANAVQAEIFNDEHSGGG